MPEHFSVLSLPSSVTFADAVASCNAMREDLRNACIGAQNKVVVIDAGAVRSFDLSVLAVLLQCRRDAQERGYTLAVKDMPDKLRELAHLYGVITLLPDA